MFDWDRSGDVQRQRQLGAGVEGRPKRRIVEQRSDQIPVVPHPLAVDDTGWLEKVQGGLGRDVEHLTGVLSADHRQLILDPHPDMFTKQPHRGRFDHRITAQNHRHTTSGLPLL